MCPNGTYGLYAGSVGCVSCPVGQYSTSPGSLGCLTCGFRQTNSQKSDSCVCIVGSSAILCLPCAPGILCPFCLFVFVFYHLTSFFIGHFWSNSVCIPCPNGTRLSENVQDTCVPCSPGSYSNSLSPGLCIQCPVSTYNAISGSSLCIGCPETMVAVPNRTLCLPAVSMCSAFGLGGGIGWYYDIYQQTCIRCIPCTEGYFVTRSCTPVTNTVCGVCVVCPILGWVVQQQCSTYADTVCQQCTPGYYANASVVCQQCQAGFYTANRGSASCGKCQRGWPSVDRTTCWQKHQPGAYLALTNNFVECPAGSYGPGNGGCYPCLGRWDPYTTGLTSCSGCTASLVTGLCPNELPPIQCAS